MKLLLTSILLCFTIHLLLSQSFTNNIWPCSHSNQDCHSDLSAYDEYKALQQLNNQNLETQLLKRNNFTHKLDSSYSWILENNKEIITRKSEFIFNTEENSELVLNYKNDLINNKWLPNRFTLNSYNKMNLLTKRSFTNWDGSMSDFNHNNPYTLSNYKYNSEGIIIISEGSNQNDIIKNRITNRIIFHYDSLGTSLGLSYYFRTANIDTLTHMKETIYNYNENMQLESIVNKVLDLQIGWRVNDSTYFDYDLFGNIISEFEYIWNGEEAFGFRPFTENYYFYDNKNQVTDKTHKFQYDEENNSLKYESFFEYTYHEYGSLQQEVNFISGFYDPRQILSETSYSRYTDILTENTLRPRQGPFSDINLHNEKYVLNINEKYFVRDYGYRDLDYRIQDFYSEIDPVSTTNPVISDSDFLKVSPNPTSDFINFDWTDYSGELDITLYNVTGQKVRSQRSNNNSAVDLTTLDSGVYFYTVGAGERVVSGRVVKM